MASIFMQSSQSFVCIIIFSINDFISCFNVPVVKVLSIPMVTSTRPISRSFPLRVWEVEPQEDRVPRIDGTVGIPGINSPDERVPDCSPAVFFKVPPMEENSMLTITKNFSCPNNRDTAEVTFC